MEYNKHRSYQVLFITKLFALLLVASYIQGSVERNYKGCPARLVVAGTMQV